MAQNWNVIVVVICSAKLLLAAAEANETLRVCLPELGCLQGKNMPGLRTEKFEAFLGVPYAQPPLGKLRLQNPEPVIAWNNTLDATKPKPQCLQKNYFQNFWPISGEEDCLYLNLYRPVPSGQDPLPVIFYIHGGCFFYGSVQPQILGPEYFMDTGEVILVMAAYRLGPFGFLASGDEVMPGNFGLKDQNLALKWVNQHIAAFGGDPKNVIIAGHSVGGSSVHFHMLYELSNNLFARAIVVGGSALAPFVAVQPQPLQVTTQLAQTAGIANPAQLKTTELLSALQKLDALAILNAGDAFKSWYITPLINFRPNIEQANWKNAFITEDPEQRARNGNFQPVPWMMGIVPCEGEGAIMTLDILEHDDLTVEFNKNFDEMLKKLLEFTSDEIAQLDAKTMKLIVDKYFQGIHELNNQTAMGFRQIVGDWAFHYPIYRGIKHYLNYSPQSVYIMKFNYSGPYSYSMFSRSGQGKNYGVSHIDDMFYLFRQPLLIAKDYDRSSTEAAVVQSLVGTYVEYAKNGFSKNTLYKPCDKSALVNTPDGICEYVTYANDGQSFKIFTENKFDVDNMHFWENIMEDTKDDGNVK